MTTIDSPTTGQFTAPRISLLQRLVQAAGAEGMLLTASLVLAVVHGLIYVFLIPPWQHYDEPNHFEYVWLLANRDGLPEIGDYDQSMRRAVATSMIETGFFKHLDFLPDLEANDRPVWIGSYTQLGDPPLYYFLASLPLRLSPGMSIEQQLYQARLVSLGLYLLSIAAAWGIARELTHPGSSLRWMVPVVMAALPAFTDLMTAVNNDTAAIAFFSLFLWCCIRILQKGLTSLRAVAALALMAACIFSKSTLVIVLPLFVLALLLRGLRGRWSWIAWGFLGAAGAASILLLFGYGDAAHWYRHTFQSANARTQVGGAVSGQHSFVLEFQPDSPEKSTQLHQFLPPDAARLLVGKTLTIGAWMWASQPVTVRTPTLHVFDGNQRYYEEVTLGATPEFFAYTVTPYGSLAWTEVLLAPLPKNYTGALQVYYDGLVLVEGERPLSEAPVLEDIQGQEGIWGGAPFTNLLRNSSAEAAGVRVQPWVDRTGMRFLPDEGRPSLVLHSVLDLPSTGWYYWVTSQNQLRTFWAKFGWGNVPLLGRKPYRVFFAITLLGMIGAAIVLLRKRRGLPWRSLVFLGVVMLLVWLPSLTRGVFYLIHRPYIPPARYAYPAIVPTLLLLSAGWRFWLPGKVWSYARIALLLALGLMTLYSLYSIWVYFALG